MLFFLFNYYNSQKNIFCNLYLVICILYVPAYLLDSRESKRGELSELNHFQKSYKRVHYHIFLIYNGKTPNYFKNSIEKSWKMWLLNSQFKLMEKKYLVGCLVVYPHITRSKNLEGSVFWRQKKFQKDLNNNSPHEAIDYIQNSSWKLSVFSVWDKGS